MVSDAFGFDSAEYESVDDSGDLTPYDFRDLERKARYNALPDDIKECVEQLKEFYGFTDEGWRGIADQCMADSTAATQLLDYLGAL